MHMGHARTHVYTHKHTHMGACARTHTCMHTHAHGRTSTRTHAHTHTRAPMHMGHTHVYTHKHTRAHAHTRARRPEALRGRTPRAAALLPVIACVFHNVHKECEFLWQLEKQAYEEIAGNGKSGEEPCAVDRLGPALGEPGAARTDLLHPRGTGTAPGKRQTRVINRFQTWMTPAPSPTTSRAHPPFPPCAVPRTGSSVGSVGSRGPSAAPWGRCRRPRSPHPEGRSEARAWPAMTEPTARPGGEGLHPGATGERGSEAPPLRTARGRCLCRPPPAGESSLLRQTAEKLKTAKEVGLGKTRLKCNIATV